MPAGINTIVAPSTSETISGVGSGGPSSLCVQAYIPTLTMPMSIFKLTLRIFNSSLRLNDMGSVFNVPFSNPPAPLLQATGSVFWLRYVLRF